MKTVDYMESFISLSAKEKFFKIKELKEKIKEIRKTGIEEIKLKTTKAVLQWSIENFLSPKTSPPTMQELSLYINMENIEENIIENSL